MKKLNKLQINSEKLMKNDELLTLRGGYGDFFVYCFKDGVPCGNWPVGDCEIIAMERCDEMCPDWTNAGCFTR